jgi:hypothetical protein
MHGKHSLLLYYIKFGCMFHWYPPSSACTPYMIYTIIFFKSCCFFVQLFKISLITYIVKSVFYRILQDVKLVHVLLCNCILIITVLFQSSLFMLYLCGMFCTFSLLCLTFLNVYLHNQTTVCFMSCFLCIFSERGCLFISRLLSPQISRPIKVVNTKQSFWSWEDMSTYWVFSVFCVCCTNMQACYFSMLYVMGMSCFQVKCMCF